MPKHRYFHFDEATGTFIELMDQGPVRLARLFAIAAVLLVAASVFL